MRNTIRKESKKGHSEYEDIDQSLRVDLETILRYDVQGARL